MTKKQTIFHRHVQSHELPTTPFDREIIKAAGFPITINNNGTREQLSVAEVVIKKLVENALKGSTHGLGQFIRHLSAAKDREMAETAKQVEFGLELKEQQQRQLDAHISSKVDARGILPHPDDIHVDPDKGFVITGPMNKEELQAVEAQAAQRDAFVVQSALEQRYCWPDLENPCQLPQILHAERGSSLFLATMLDGYLPERFRLNDPQWLEKSLRLRRLTKRALIKFTGQTWRSIGEPKPREWLTPPIEKTYQVYQIAIRFAPDIKRRLVDSDTPDGILKLMTQMCSEAVQPLQSDKLN